MSKPKYDAEFNKTRWANCKVTPSRLVEVTKVAKWIVANRSRYEIVQKNTGVPWWFIGCLHVREAGSTAKAFQCYLGNGEPLNRVTRLVPAGRGPFATWEDGACDALRIQKFDKIADWSVEHSLYLAEEYNGFGYAAKGLPSPYVWGATNYQKPGKYIKDGVFDASVTDTQIGVAAMLQIISALVGGILPGIITNLTSPQNPGAGVTVPAAATNTNFLGAIVGALMAGFAGAGFGTDAIHTVATLAGALGAVLSTLNHLHLTNASNANTMALIEQLLAQIAAYQPPVPDIPEATPETPTVS
jgi:lysozyme family protein